MRHNSATSKTLSQLPASPVQPRFDRPFGTAHHVRNFRATEVILIEQQKTKSVIVPQLADGVLQLIGKVPRIAGTRSDGLVNKQRSPRIPRPLLQSRATPIRGNREDPWFQRALRVPRLQAAKSPEKDVLRHVFRVFTLSQHPETKGENQRLEALDQFARSSLLAAETPLDQACFVGHSTPCASISKYLGRAPLGFSHFGPTPKT
jgi:hypothetical protein